MNAQTIIEKIESWKRPNSKNALRLLDTIDSSFPGACDDCREALENYQDLAEDTESEAEDRKDAWQDFIDSLESITARIEESV